MENMIKKLMITLIFIFLAGCWDQAELPERGFVMGVAIDLSEANQVELTTQVYKPASGIKAAKTGDAFINITTVNENVFEAVRDIPSQLGRRAQWSHMGVIIIGDEFVQNQNINNVLDFFYRDNEVRLSSYIMIVEGKASQYLEIKPLIENTTSQQIEESQRSAAGSSAKSFEYKLLDLFIQLRSETGNAVIPYVHVNEPQENKISVGGSALIKAGEMIGQLTPKETESLVMLLNKFKTGIIKVPCMSPSKSNSFTKESVEVITSKVKIKSKASMDSVDVQIGAEINGSVGELRCSDVSDAELEKAFIESVKQIIEQDLQKTVKKLQDMKIDVLGIGNQIYAQNPSLWKDLKEDWDEHFAVAHIEVEAEVIISDTGKIIGKSANSIRR